MLGSSPRGRRARIGSSRVPSCGSPTISGARIGRYPSAGKLADQRTAATEFTIESALGRGAGYWRQAWRAGCKKYRESRRYHANQLTRPHEDDSARAPDLTPGEGFHLDLDDGALNGEFLSDRYGQATVEAPAYYESRPANVGGEDGLRLTYWTLFAASRATATSPAAHEGDWQRIEVLLRGADGRYEPDSVRLQRRDGSWRRIPWRAIDRSAAAPGPRTHPVILAAGGSHEFTPSQGGDGGCFGCGRWATWEHLEDVRAQDWYGFGGAWGEMGPTAATTGPLGPHGEWTTGAVTQQYRRGKRITDEQEAKERAEEVKLFKAGGPEPKKWITDPVTQLAPLIHLHARETSFPISADRFIERATLKWKDGPCLKLDDVATGRQADRKTADPTVPRLDPARMGGSEPYSRRALDPACRRPKGRRYTTADLTRPYDDGDRAPGLDNESGFYLDLLSDSRDGDPSFATSNGQRYLRHVPVYYERERVTIDGQPHERFTYWLLYGYRGAPRPGAESVGADEGDWKRLDVITRTAAGARRWIPVAVRLHADDGQTWEVPWSSLGRDGSHPVLYSAPMGHVLYPAPGYHWRRAQVEGEELPLRDTAASCPECPRLDSWRDVRQAARQPWFGFGGGWGLSFAGSDTSAPLGPG